jgi:FkbM family methyltransferase
MMKTLLHRIYTSSLNLYVRKRDTGSLYCRYYEILIRWLAILLARATGFTFPERCTGGWWWIWRWRFEVLMGWYELECAALFRKLIAPGSTVLDIGGHIGLHSRLFSRLVGPKGRVLVFEANPDNVAVLQRNLAGARYRNVEIIWSAVSSSDGKALLHISPGHSNHSLLPGYTEAVKQVEVPVVSIDSYLSRHNVGRVDFVKSDTEGADPQVIQGMAHTIAATPGLALLVEYNPAAIRCGPVSPEAFLADLASRGLGVKVISPDGTLSDRIPELKGNEYVNLLCTRHGTRG